MQWCSTLGCSPSSCVAAVPRLDSSHSTPRSATSVASWDQKRRKFERNRCLLAFHIMGYGSALPRVASNESAIRCTRSLFSTSS